jgi:hypothetical protein
MAPLPLFKLFAVLFKEISKPLAAEIKRRAHEHATMKRYAMVLGRTWEGMTQRAEIWTRGHRVKEVRLRRPQLRASTKEQNGCSPRHPYLGVPAPRRSRRLQIKPINDSHALSVGADLLSQTFVLSSALGLVLLEYYRSSSATAAAAAQKKEEKEARQVVKERRLAAIEASLADMDRRLQALERQQHSWLPALPHLPAFNPFAAQLSAAAPAGSGAASEPRSEAETASGNLRDAHASHAAVNAAEATAGAAHRLLEPPQQTHQQAGVVPVGGHHRPDDVMVALEGQEEDRERLGVEAARADDGSGLRENGAAAAAPAAPPGGGSSSWWWGWVWQRQQGAAAGAGTLPAPSSYQRQPQLR